MIKARTKKKIRKNVVIYTKGVRKALQLFKNTTRTRYIYDFQTAVSSLPPIDFNPPSLISKIMKESEIIPAESIFSDSQAFEAILKIINKFYFFIILINPQKRGLLFKISEEILEVAYRISKKMKVLN